jgi:hypothetical protein
MENFKKLIYELFSNEIKHLSAEEEKELDLMLTQKTSELENFEYMIYNLENDRENFKKSCDSLLDLIGANDVEGDT